MKSKTLLKVLAIILALGMFISYVPAAVTAENAVSQQTVTVEPAVLELMEKDGAATYWVDFEYTVDLSPAYSMEWGERGWFVYNTLKAQADKSQATAISLLQNAGVKYESFWIANRILVKESNRTMLASLQQLPGVTAIRAPKTYSIWEPELTDAEPTAVESNLTHVRAPEAWALGYEGQGAVVANIDTGVRYSHQALVNQYRGNNGDGTFTHDYNWLNPINHSDNVPRDGHNHGTHTMGTMVGDDGADNQIGMAPGAQWIACAGCPDGSCPDAALLGCAQFVTAPTKTDGTDPDPDMRPNVVNNSWGGCSQSYDPWYRESVDAWQAAGVYPVFSNGNSSNCGYPSPPGLNTVGNPARYGNVSGVGSTGKDNGTYATHSNWGPTDNLDEINPTDGFANMKPQVLAPGVGIRSSVKASDTSYGGMTGTSMSAPHFAGLLALMYSAGPCLVGDYSAAELIIESTAVDMVYDDGSDLTPTNFPNFATGWGEIDALAAVQVAAGMCGNSTINGTVVSDSNMPIQGAKVQMTGTEPINARTVYTNAEGQYSATVNADTYTMTASAFGFIPQTVEGVEVAEEATVTQNFVLEELPNTRVFGVVYDGGLNENIRHGYPLYAKLTFSMTGFSESVFTDPFTGEYEITLYNSQTYHVVVEPMLYGYTPYEQDLPIQQGATELEQDFYVNVDLAGCSAPGYGPEYDFRYDFEASDHGFTPGGTNSSWAWGEFTSGPGAAHSGNKGIATNPAGNYNNSELSWMMSPAIDLSGYGDQTPIIEFWQWVWTESATSTWDQITFQVSKDGGTTWINKYGPTQRQDTAWNKVTVELDPTYNVANFRMRFYFKSDSSVNKLGWYVDDIGIASFSPPPPTTAYTADFENGDGGWTTSVEAGGGTNSWAWGEPTAHGTYPGGAHSGTSLWATGLNAVYNANERSLVTSPVIDLSQYAGEGLAPTLSFWHWIDTESNTWDWGEVRVSKDGGTTYTTVYQKFGDIMNWTQKEIILDPSYTTDSFRVQYFLRTDGSGHYAGWFIDDVMVSVSEPYAVAVPCGKIPGGLVGGYVYDANFPEEKLLEASVMTPTAGDTTAADPANPAQDGLYYFFQDTNGDPQDVEFTVSKSKYETKVETHPIAQDVVNHIDFMIGAGMIVADPTELYRTIFLHDDPETTTLTLMNQGAGGANFTITEQDAGMQPYRIPAFTGEVEQSDEPTSIFRDPKAAAATGALTLDAASSRYGITEAPPAFGVDLFTDKLYKWEDASVPGGSTLVGTPGGTSLFAGDFLGGDFSTLYVISYDNNNLYAVDTETGAGTLIGRTNPPTGTFSGITGVGNTMYGVATSCGTSSVLTTIDVETAAVQTIGTIANATCLIDLSYVPDTGMLYGVDLVNDTFVMIDPATAASTVVGNTGVNANYAQGMDYDEENNVFYWAAYTSGPELRIIDINTGASTRIGAFTLGEVDSYAIAAGGAAADVPWLSEDIVEGYIPANEEVEVQVTFDATDIEQPGWYHAFLKIGTDTPYAVPDIPVTMHVVRPLNYGNIKGTVSVYEKCDINPTPYEEAIVSFYQDGVKKFSTMTNEEGYYSYSLKNGVYDVEVVIDGYVSQIETGVELGWDEDVTVDFILRKMAACLTVVPDAYYQELYPDDTAVQTMTLLNTGAMEAVFEITERPGDGPVPFADYEFKVDDGSLEDSIGLTSGGQFIWGNHFTVSDDILPFTLDTVQVMWNDSVAATDKVTIAIFHDPDRNPQNGATFVTKLESTVQKNDKTFVNYDFDDPALITEPGDILIMVVNRSGSAGYSDFPAGIDQTGQKMRRSWIGLYSGSVPEVPTLPPDGDWAIIDDIAASLAGNWTIRGLGSAGSADIIWLTEDKLAGVVPPDGGTEEITLTFDSTGLTTGDYFGTLVVANPPDPKINVPVQLRVLPFNMQYMPLIFRYFPVPGQR